MSNTITEIEVPDTYLESAWLGDWEAAYDIALTQMRTYVHAVLAPINPAWTAVTGYYAAFFACRALLYGVGVGHRTLSRRGIVHGGLYELRIAPGHSVGRSILVCRSQGQGGSHKAAWREFDSLLGELLAVGGLDLASTNIISTLRTLIGVPQHVSAFRNSVNYSLDIARAPVQMWPSEVVRVRDPEMLEQSLSSVQPVRGEHRIEILLLAALSWQRDLYADYLARAKRPDRRPGKGRLTSVDQEAVGVRSLLKGWV